MSTKRKIYLPTISNIGSGSAAGSVGQVDLPLYYKYYEIGFEYTDSATTPQDIICSPTGASYAGSTAGGLLGDILLKINSNVKRTCSAQELDHLNSVNGAQFARQQIVVGTLGSGGTLKQILRMHFAEPWRRDKEDVIAGATNLTPTFGVSSAQLSIQLGSAWPTTGSLVVYAVVDVPDTAVPSQGALCKIVTRQQITASGNSIDLTTLDQSGYYQTLLLKHPTNPSSLSPVPYIGKAVLKVNGTVFRELTREANYADLVMNEMNPVNNIAAGSFSTIGVSYGPFGYDLVLDDDDPINSALPASGQNFILHLDFYSTGTLNGGVVSASASGSIVAIIERVQFGW